MTTATKFIVWDWNGTLLDDTGVILSAVNRSLEKIRKPIDLAELRRHSAIPLQQFWRNLGLAEEIIVAHQGRLSATFHDHYESNVATAELRTGSAALLRQTRKAGIAHMILSNHIVAAIEAQLARLASHDIFSHVLAFADRQEQLAMKMRKGERLQHFMRENALRPENGVIVGDTVEEAEIGQQTGLASIVITGGIHTEEHLRTARPDHVVHHLDEMLPILRTRGLLS